MIFSSLIFPLVVSWTDPSPGDYDLFEIFDDVDTEPNFFALNSEPSLASPDQLSGEISELASDTDPDPDLWAKASGECSMNDQSTNDIQKRIAVCPDLGSLNEPGAGAIEQLKLPSALEVGKGLVQTATSDDINICGPINVFNARIFAACDSGLDEDRILNQLTGEYSLIDCERGKLKCFFLAQLKPIVQTLEADERRQSI